MTARADQSASREISDGARFSPAVLAAGGVGNLLEWYDFGLYGYFAPVLARLFFPSDDPLASLIGAYGGFAVGFAMRPIGAAVLGTIGDRVGRRFVLLLSVTLSLTSKSLVSIARRCISITDEAALASSTVNSPAAIALASSPTAPAM